jgi:GT2 family glycosyltransferase
VYKKSIIDQIGGFREGYEGSQDHDLALRFIEKIAPSQVQHIPRVLYHWRAHAQSTAQDSAAKPYAAIAGEKALTEHFARIGVNARSEYCGYGYRVRYALPAKPRLVSLIIPTRNAHRLVRQCIESIRNKTVYTNYEIILVDNGSDDPESLRYFDELTTQGVRVIRDDRPFNYSALNNAAVQQARGDLIGLINNDVEVIEPGWLCEMISHAERPEVGAVGAKLLYPNNTIQHAGVVIGLGGVAGHSHKYFEHDASGYFFRLKLTSAFSAVTAACLVIRKDVFQEVGGLDEDNLAVAFNDVDFCLKVREAGYRNIFTPYASLYHHESVSRGQDDTPEKRQRFSNELRYMKKKWGNTLLRDPAYSPNLTLDREDFALALTPRLEHLGHE